MMAMRTHRRDKRHPLHINSVRPLMRKVLKSMDTVRVEDVRQYRVLHNERPHPPKDGCSANPLGRGIIVTTLMRSKTCGSKLFVTIWRS